MDQTLSDSRQQIRRYLAAHQRFVFILALTIDMWPKLRRPTFYHRVSTKSEKKTFDYHYPTCTVNQTSPRSQKTWAQHNLASRWELRLLESFVGSLDEFKLTNSIWATLFPTCAINPKVMWSNCHPSLLNVSAYALLQLVVFVVNCFKINAADLNWPEQTPI